MEISLYIILLNAVLVSVCVLFCYGDQNVTDGNEYANQTQFGECEITIDLNVVNQTGTIRSEDYPNSYPGDFRCAYRFVSFDNKRIQINFREFNLYLPSETADSISSNCHQKYDSLRAYTKLGDRMSEIASFCGSRRPPSLMSANDYLSLEFVTNTHVRVMKDSNTKYRFEFEYRFVDDFGINSEHAVQPNSACHFVYNSTLGLNGSISSPNYPGLYPRNTDCVYEFYGTKNQGVRFRFTYFDVEGYGKCQNDSQSDYVIFSNNRTTDRTQQRYCGTETPMRYPIVSDSDYFRMVFHSNAFFDSTGFFALYQFVDKVDTDDDNNWTTTPATVEPSITNATEPPITNATEPSMTNATEPSSTTAVSLGLQDSKSSVEMLRITPMLLFFTLLLTTVRLYQFSCYNGVCCD